MKKRNTKNEQNALELRNIRASDVCTLKYAHNEVKEIMNRSYMASGLIITIHDLSGNVAMRSVCINDGLSPETLQAIAADIKRTSEQRIALNRIG